MSTADLPVTGRAPLAPDTDPWSAVASGPTAAGARRTVVAGRVLLADRGRTTVDDRVVRDRIVELRRRTAGEGCP